VCALWHAQRWHISSFTVINYEVCVTLCDLAGMCSVCALWHVQRWHISSFTIISYEVCVHLCTCVTLQACAVCVRYGMCSNVTSKTLPKVMKFVCTLVPVQPCRHVQRVCAMACAAMAHQLIHRNQL